MSTGVFKISISTNLIWGISNRFQLLSPAQRQILYILLTRPPLSSDRSQILVRLACIKHAASVRPEPGSNSPLSESFIASITRVIVLTHYIFRLSTSVFSLRINKFFFSYSVFKVPIADFNLTRIFTGIYFFAEHKAPLVPAGQPQGQKRTGLPAQLCHGPFCRGQLVLFMQIKPITKAEEAKKRAEATTKKAETEKK